MEYRSWNQARSTTFLPGVLVGSLLLTATAGGWARAPEALTSERLASYTLEELLDVRVTSVDTDLRQDVGEAAAIHIITRADIERSGYRTLPDLLRLVPGVHVGQIAKFDFAVSARGFNGNFADKMEVLLDGRRLQTPLFLGVQWGLYDTYIPDIERIEVIRGPGGAQWGINAVNGIINIVTRNARETHGLHAHAGGGTEEQAFGGARLGGESEGGLHYRVWSKAFRRDASVLADGRESSDGSNPFQLGWRLDWGDPQADLFNVQGDAWGRSERDIDAVFAPGQDGPQPHPVKDHFRGANLVARWSRKLSPNSSLRMQAYWDYLLRDAELLGDERNSVDVSATHAWRINPVHNLTWGGSIYTSADTVASSFSVKLTPRQRTLTTLSLFAQDQITLAPERSFLTLGSKIEHNPFTGIEVQPSVRAIHYFDREHSVWAAGSRALRTPSRLDRSVRFTVDQLDNDVFLAVFGNDDFESEQVLAYELGYRWTPRRVIDADLALFYNDYDRLRAFEGPGDAIVEDDATFIPLTATNLNGASTWGAELALGWRLSDACTARLGYTHFRMQLDAAPGTAPSVINATEGNDPRHQAFADLRWNVSRSIQTDATVRHVSAMAALGVQQFTELDLRAAWKLHADWRLAVVGKNLLEESHVEYASAITFGRQIAVERHGWLELTWTPSDF